MTKNKLNAILWYIASALSYITAILWFISSSNLFYLGFMYIALGSTFLCLGTVYMNKHRKSNGYTRKEKQNKKDDKN